MRRLLTHKILFKYLFWIWLLIIFILSSLPNIPTQKINVWDEPWRLDYLEHFLVFGGLASLFTAWKADENGQFLILKYWRALAILIIFAAADEIHQIYIPGRSFNPLDLIYNVLGLLTFFFIAPYFIGRIYKK